MNKIIIFLISLAFAGSLVIINPVPAQGEVGGSAMKASIDTQLNAAAGTKGADYPSPVDPRYTVVFIIRILLTFLGTVFLCLMIYAGFLWMTAGGSEEKAEKAKKLIYQSVIGLIIIFAAYSITIFAFKIAVNYFLDPIGGGSMIKPDLP
ncbi:MAG: hypothetical protein ABIH87_02190 [bacterium]